jgi:hypothetical protein
MGTWNMYIYFRPLTCFCSSVFIPRSGYLTFSLQCLKPYMRTSPNFQELGVIYASIKFLWLQYKSKIHVKNYSRCLYIHVTSCGICQCLHIFWWDYACCSWTTYGITTWSFRISSIVSYKVKEKVMNYLSLCWLPVANFMCFNGLALFGVKTAWSPLTKECLASSSSLWSQFNHLGLQ